MRSLTIITLLAVCLAACGDDGGNTSADAAAGAPDADPATPDAEACAESLTVADDGTGIAADLVISEIDPGTHIELFNATGADIALSGAAHQFCSPFTYSALSSLAGSTVVPAGGYATVPWPSSFTDTDAGGEIQLYKDGNFTNDSSIIDFVCWGSNPHGTRKGQAEATGKWVGDCAPAITGGAIHRTDNSTGTGAASYDVASPPSPQNCR